MEEPLLTADVELQRRAGLLEHSKSLRSEKEEGAYGGEELRPPCLLLAGERERDLDLERERLREDRDLLLDLKG